MIQTTVEWFNQQLVDRQNGNNYGGSWDEILEQAKEMEAKQRQEDTNHGYSQGYDDASQGKEPMRPKIINRKQIKEFLDKLDQLCWEYGCEIKPTHPIPQEEHATVTITNNTETVKLTYIDGEGIGIGGDTTYKSE
jgi:hypothetical protein